jgi:hypothetical protein
VVAVLSLLFVTFGGSGSAAASAHCEELPYTITSNPTEATIDVNSDVTITLSVLNGCGDPAGNWPIAYEVIGVHTRAGLLLTHPDGDAELIYQGVIAGSDGITFLPVGGVTAANAVVEWTGSRLPEVCTDPGVKQCGELLAPEDDDLEVSPEDVVCLDVNCYPAPSLTKLQACTGGEDQVFGGWQSTEANGITAKILYTDNPVDKNCISGSIRTAHMTRDSAAGWTDWVEIGSYKYRDEDGKVGHCLFTEWGENEQAEIPEGTLAANWDCTAHFTPGKYDKFRVTNIPGTGKWQLYVNHLVAGDGEGWQRIATTGPMGWGHGVASGEAARFGENTGMKSKFRKLRIKNGNENWVYMPSNQCLFDDTSDWRYDWVSDRAFNVINSSIDNCP